MNDIHDIKPPISLEYISREAILAISLVFCVFLISLITWLIYRYLKKRLKDNKIEEGAIEQKIDYQAEAGNRFQKARKLIDLGLFKEFHLEAALIIREYLSGQFGVEAIDMTSREIFDLPQLSSEIKEEMKKFFTMNDYSKFAGAKEEEGAARAVLESGARIIECKK